MRNIKRNTALVGASAIIAAFGVGGVMTAHASTGQDSGSTSVVQKGTEKEAPEGSEAAETDDGPDVGPDANPNEPGHQDADESGEAEGPEGAEGAEAAETNDGPDVGPDANPNEPGHQDADESGEATK